MCNFFSFISDNEGGYLYFNWNERKKLLESNPKDYNPDSHSSIAAKSGISVLHESLHAKYEYNPLTGKFVIDQPGTDSENIDAEHWVRNLGFSKIVKPLTIKPIINPIKMEKTQITEKDIALLYQWASVRDSVWDSVWASVWASVRDSVWDSVRDSVWASVRASVWDSVQDSVRDSVWDSVGASVRDSVGASVRDSVWDSVRASVWDSVQDSVRDSVWASVWGYISSFFNIAYKHDFSSIVKLWEHGLVPSFDGTTWRLHGHKGAVLYEEKIS